MPAVGPLHPVKGARRLRPVQKKNKPPFQSDMSTLSGSLQSMAFSAMGLLDLRKIRKLYESMTTHMEKPENKIQMDTEVIRETVTIMEKTMTTMAYDHYIELGELCVAHCDPDAFKSPRLKKLAATSRESAKALVADLIRARDAGDPSYVTEAIALTTDNAYGILTGSRRHIAHLLSELIRADERWEGCDELWKRHSGRDFNKMMVALEACLCQTWLCWGYYLVTGRYALDKSIYNVLAAGTKLVIDPVVATRVFGEDVKKAAKTAVSSSYEVFDKVRDMAKASGNVATCTYALKSVEDVVYRKSAAASAEVEADPRPQTPAAAVAAA